LDNVTTFKLENRIRAGTIPVCYLEGSGFKFGFRHRLFKLKFLFFSFTPSRQILSSDKTRVLLTCNSYNVIGEQVNAVG